MFLITVYGAGELSILHHPSSLVFKGHDHVRESTLKEIYSASLGFSTEHYSNWQGLYIDDPFNLAEALVTVAVDGISSIDQQKGHHFPLRTDEDDPDIYQALQKRILERYPESNSNLVKVDLSRGLYDVNSMYFFVDNIINSVVLFQTEKFDIFKNIKSDKPKKTQHNFLKLTVDEDREFLKEITLLNSIAAQVFLF